MRSSLRYGDRSHDLVFEEAIVHLEGEFSGNLDLRLVIDPPVSKRSLLDSLWIEVQGEEGLLDVVGYLQDGGSWKLTFCSEHIRESLEVPRSVEAFWGSAKETYLGAIPCSQAAESEALAESAAALTPEDIYGPAAIRRANVRGVLALLGLLLFFLATIYLVFPEVREWLKNLVR